MPTYSQPLEMPNYTAYDLHLSLQKSTGCDISHGIMPHILSILESQTAFDIFYLGTQTDTKVILHYWRWI